VAVAVRMPREFQRFHLAEGKLVDYFDGGIFGSHDGKHIIIARENIHENIKRPSLLLDDSRYDYQASEAAGLDFVLIPGWTETAD
jgi:hypothetical protein